MWARENVGAIIAAQTTSGFPLLADFQTAYGAQLLGATVVRVRGETRFKPVAAASYSTVAAMAVLPDNTPTVDPLGTTGAFIDWMAYQPILGDIAQTGADSVRANTWDVKSSRKIEELGEGLFMMVSNPLAGTAAEFSAVLSIGLKLP